MAHRNNRTRVLDKVGPLVVSGMRDDPTRMSAWTAGQIGDLSGRIAVVTGANSGLGLATARELARAGATVVPTARDDAKAAATREAITSDVPRAELDPRLLDLAS